MTDLGESNATLVIAVNVALGVLVAGSVLAIAVAAVKDVLARRRLRGPVPEGWPPATPDRK